EAAIVSRHALSLVPNLHIGRMHLGLHFDSDGQRNGVEVRQHLHAAAGVHMWKMNRGQIKTFFRQCLQVFSLQIHSCTHRLGPLANQTLLIVPGCFQQEEVQRFPTGNLRNRHHVVPAKVPAFSFHSTLLVTFRRGAELRLETPMRSEGYEPRGLLSLVPAQKLHHCTLKVVVPQDSKHSTEIEKRLFMRFQKRLLAGVREGAMERSSTGHTAHAKYVGQLSLSADIRVGLIPVHLRFSTPNIGLWNERLAVNHRQREFSFANVASDRRLGHFHFWHLRSDPAPDPMCGVPLLPGGFLVRFQNCIDESYRRFQLRSLSYRCLAPYRNSAEHRLPYHSSMNPQLLGDPSNRATTMLILAPNLLE